MRVHGRARVDPTNPQAFGVCDRCRFLYNLVDLVFQYEWVGDKLTNLWLRVCRRCLDKPHEFTRPAVLPPDPVPVWQPRPDNYASAEGPPPPNVYVQQLVTGHTLPSPPTGLPSPRPIQFAD
jgi:hypothetical protein